MCVLQVIYIQKEEVNREMVYPMHPSSIEGVEDMSTLAELHEAAIMHNLFLRYQKDNIYVRHSTVLICEHIYCNLYHHDVPDIYECIVFSRVYLSYTARHWMSSIKKFGVFFNRSAVQQHDMVYFKQTA